MATAGSGMAIISLDGRWQEVNPALCRMLDLAPERLQRQPVQGFIHPADAAAENTARQQALLLHGEDAVTTELRYLRADGDTLEVRQRLVSLRDVDGNPQHLLVHLEDLGEQRRTERELHQPAESFDRCVLERTAALEAASRRWESFAYGVSHDLRAPLRAIDGFARQLERHAGPGMDPTSRDNLQRIRAASHRMAGLMDSLLELSRIGGAELRPEPVDITLLAEWSAAELKEAHPQRGSQVAIQPGLEVMGDARLLKTLLTQLLCNAWQFARKDADVRFEVTGSRRPDGLQFAVRDQGIGFDMAYADKLFQPFQRLHGSDDGAGNGLGLSIAQQVVERHGGRIWAEATPSQGATFHVTLIDLDPTEDAE